MKTLGMLLKNIFKKKEYVFCFLIGIYSAVLLWITLFSRIGDEYRGFLYPFHSYVEISRGNKTFLLENLENIILFVPLGIILKCVGMRTLKRTTKIGLTISLFIEMLQLLFSLGIFECDDLMHNTIGTMLGYCLVKSIKCDILIKMNTRMKVAILLSLILSLMIPFGYQEARYQKWVKIASLHDREDGAENLLVLNGKNGNAWNTDVHVEFLGDGSIHIHGTADKRAWWPIGKVILEPGTYSFEGLSDVKEKTVGLELELYNQRFAPDVGVNEKVQFTLKEITELKVYVIVYEGCDCDVIAVPVLYREG